MWPGGSYPTPLGLFPHLPVASVGLNKSISCRQQALNVAFIITSITHTAFSRACRLEGALTSSLWSPHDEPSKPADHKVEAGEPCPSPARLHQEVHQPPGPGVVHSSPPSSPLPPPVETFSLFPKAARELHAGLQQPGVLGHLCISSSPFWPSLSRPIPLHPCSRHGGPHTCWARSARG